MKYALSVLVFFVAFAGFTQKEIQFVPPVKQTDKPVPRPPLNNKERDTLEIILDSNDRILFYLPNPQMREVFAEKLSERISLTASQQKEFARIDVFGCAFSDVVAYLDLGETGRSKLMADTAYKGIPYEDIEKWLSVSERALTRFSQRKVNISKYPNAAVSDFTPVYVLEPGVHAKFRTFNRLSSEVSRFIWNHPSIKMYKVSKNGVRSTVFKDPSFSVHDFDLEGIPAPIYPELSMEVQIRADIPAQFPGGNAALETYLSEHKIIPASVATGKIEGKVYVRLVITAEGKINHVSISKGIAGCPECDQEAKRLALAMPDWIPGQLNGAAVASFYALLVTF